MKHVVKFFCNIFRLIGMLSLFSAIVVIVMLLTGIVTDSEGIRWGQVILSSLSIIFCIAVIVISFMDISPIKALIFWAIYGIGVIGLSIVAKNIAEDPIIDFLTEWFYIFQCVTVIFGTVGTCVIKKINMDN